MPRLASRMYGSLGDVGDSGLPRLPESASNSETHVQQGLDVRGVTLVESGHRRWGKLIVVGLAAVTAAVVLRAGRQTPAGNEAEGFHDTLKEVGAVPSARGGQPGVGTSSTPLVANVEVVEDGRPGIDATTLPEVAFTAFNYYSLRDGQPGQDYPWLKDVKLIEPHRETFLSVANPREGYRYEWEITNGGDADEIHSFSNGQEAIVLLTRLDENVVTLKEVDTDGTIARSIAETVMVKYVRREIRTLTDDEREELFDAMSTLWAVRADDGDGREVFGDSYSDIWAINRLHFKASSPRVCDHFHDGLGFLTNHGLISNTFEYSLQQVNPKLTLPYWDFTMEASTASTGRNDSSTAPKISPIFQESWFGTSDPVDSMVKDGRWAFTEIPRMVPNDPGGIEPDVYSKLRAPWNINQRPYLTRAIDTKMCGADIAGDYPWPTCQTHYDMVTSYSDFYSWVWESMYGPHGPVHIWIGGVVDCDETFSKIADLIGETDANALALLSFCHRKSLFRDGFWGCSESVDVEEPADEVLSSGVCGCLGHDLTQGDDYKKIYPSLINLDTVLGDYDEDTQRKTVAIICSGQMSDGDHLQASASLDPSFWPTHPTMERLWMFSVLTGHVTDFTWPDQDVTVTTDDGDIYEEIISLSSDECMGHRGSDVFPYGILVNDTTDFTVQTGIKGSPVGGGNDLTNREALAAFDPRVNGLNYIYDKFKWPHCNADGVNMDNAWKDISGLGAQTAGKRMRFEKDGPRFPMYSSLIKKTEDSKKRRLEV